jgi:hypothetical protein
MIRWKNETVSYSNDGTSLLIETQTFRCLPACAPPHSRAHQPSRPFSASSPPAGARSETLHPGVTAIPLRGAPSGVATRTSAPPTATLRTAAAALLPPGPQAGT